MAVLPAQLHLAEGSRSLLHLHRARTALTSRARGSELLKGNWASLPFWAHAGRYGCCWANAPVPLGSWDLPWMLRALSVPLLITSMSQGTPSRVRAGPGCLE